MYMPYLRHLWEEADGQRQRQAECDQAHQAVDGQQQPAVAPQELEPVWIGNSMPMNNDE